MNLSTGGHRRHTYGLSVGKHTLIAEFHTTEIAVGRNHIHMVVIDKGHEGVQLAVHIYGPCLLVLDEVSPVVSFSTS